MTHSYGEGLVRRWAPRFGLGDFRIQVLPMPTEPCDAWARSYYDLDEMWGVIDLPADADVPAPLLELLVLHELAHGLLLLSETSETGTEQACNRIARLARCDFTTRLANEQSAHQLGEDYWSGDREKSNASATDRRAWLNVVVDALPVGDREVINLIYVEGLSLRAAGQCLGGVDVHTMVRRRDRALAKLNNYFAALESANWHTARRIIALRQPEGGAEHEVVYTLHHRCSVANSLISSKVVDEDADLLIFPVGNVGYGMPKGIPFGVQATDPCPSCGRDVGVYFVWQAGATEHPGEIWTP